MGAVRAIVITSTGFVSGTMAFALLSPKREKEVQPLIDSSISSINSFFIKLIWIGYYS